MEHREKRLRLEDDECPFISQVASIPSAEPFIITSTTAESSVAASSTAPETPSETTQDTYALPTSELVVTPDKSTWQGWAEIENDPIIFNIMLREWGVRGIQVNEVVPLDAIFDSSPSSTFGLIFLSRYTSSNREKQDIEIPQRLWFANQTSTFSCGTVALMNILSNLENINLGPEISQFVTATSDMSSKDKGLALDSFEHIRKVHNSFATLIDMKSVDRRLRQDAKLFALKQKQAARISAAAAAAATTPHFPLKGKRKAKKAKKYILSDDDDDDDATVESGADTGADPTELGFHFTAYVPAHAHLWRMDGLQREPESLGPLSANNNNHNNNNNNSSGGGNSSSSSSSNWLDMAVAELSAQWLSAAENNIEFSLLSLVAATREEEEDGGVVVVVEEEEENEQAGGRLREDWGPALAELVRGVAEAAQSL